MVRFIKKILLAVFSVFLIMFESCDNDFPMTIEQHIINNSDYDVIFNLAGENYNISAGEKKNIGYTFSDMDEDYEKGTMLETGYPRVKLVVNRISRREYLYTILNITETIPCKIINNSEYQIKLFHPYLCKNYNDGILISSNSIQNEILYIEKGKFSAIYQNEFPKNNIELALQGVSTKILETEKVNESYIVLLE